MVLIKADLEQEAKANLVISVSCQSTLRNHTSPDRRLLPGNCDHTFVWSCKLEPYLSNKSPDSMSRTCVSSLFEPKWTARQLPKLPVAVPPSFLPTAEESKEVQEPFLAGLRCLPFVESVNPVFQTDTLLPKVIDVSIVAKMLGMELSKRKHVAPVCMALHHAILAN